MILETIHIDQSRLISIKETQSGIEIPDCVSFYLPSSHQFITSITYTSPYALSRKLPIVCLTIHPHSLSVLNRQTATHKWLSLKQQFNNPQPSEN